MAKTAIPSFNLQSVAQISWVVKDIDKTIEAWSSIYGIGPWKIKEFSSLDREGKPRKFRVAVTYIGEMEIELVQCIEGKMLHSHFLDSWGEGVHHIGFEVDDEEAALKYFEPRGARKLLHVPRNFVYLDAGGHGGAIFEFYRKNDNSKKTSGKNSIADTAPAPFDLKPVYQISWAVKHIDETIEAWSSIYGMGPWTFDENSGLDVKGRLWKCRMAFAYIGAIQIELVQCVEGRIVQSRFLEIWGEGVHHVGFQVDDVDATVQHFVSRGAKVVIHDPGYFAYLDAGGPGGAIFEFHRK